LLIALRDRVDEQRQVISAYRARDARLAAMVRQLAYRRSAGGSGGLPGMMSGLGGMRPPTGGGSGSGLGGFGMPNLSGLTRTRGDHNSGSGQIPMGPGRAVLLGELTPDSSPRDVAAAIVHEARRRGYSPEQAIAIISDGLQESGLRHRAVSQNGLWESYFQQDASYPGRRNPNLVINEFFNRLDRHGGPDSPNIWKSIFWLQQRPGDPSADIAFSRGRQDYLSEIQSQLPRARALYREITGT
jgi:hypothetical protein